MLNAFSSPAEFAGLRPRLCYRFAVDEVDIVSAIVVITPKRNGFCQHGISPNEVCVCSDILHPSVSVVIVVNGGKDFERPEYHLLALLGRNVLGHDANTVVRKSLGVAAAIETIQRSRVLLLAERRFDVIHKNATSRSSPFRSTKKRLPIARSSLIHL